MKAQQTSLHPLILWVLVLPAFVVGFFVPGILVRIVNELFWDGFIVVRWSEFIQSVISGWCGIYFPMRVAPSRRHVVALGFGVLVAAIVGWATLTVTLTAYWEQVGTAYFIWTIVNSILMLGAAGYAVHHSYVTQRDD